VVKRARFQWGGFLVWYDLLPRSSFAWNWNQNRPRNLDLLLTLLVMVTLLPIPIWIRSIPQKWLDEQWQTNREVLNEVLWLVLQQLTFKHIPSAESGYYKVLCADGNFRHCKPVLAGWLADCPEYSIPHHLERHVCFCCKCPKNELGDYVTTDKLHPRRGHNLYRTHSDANTKAADAELS